MKTFLSTAAFLAMLAPLPALAASGHVTGTWRNYQNQGNYCDASVRDCTQARYLKTDYHVYHPISNTKVYVKDQNGDVIGTGVTNSTGYFDIVWNRASTPTSARVYWQFEHKDDRFKIRGGTGGVIAKWTDDFNVTNGGVTNVGTLSAGTSNAISGLANVYDGADRVWYDALNYSGRMQNVFTGLTIRAWSDDCPTGCASSGSNLIKLPDTAAYQPQARIMHEMGHIAAGKSSNAAMDHGSYCWPLESGADDDGNCADGSSANWSFTSNEWRGVALKEGMATYIGDVAMYWAGAVDPRSCLSTGECSASNSIEASTTCSGTIGRTARQMDRYFWDLYDTRNEGGDDVAEPYYAVFDTLAAIPSGYDWGEKSSYRTSGGSVDCWDCFHSWEWRKAMLEDWSHAVDTVNPYSHNCMGWF